LSPELQAIVGLACLRAGDTARSDAALKALQSQSPLPAVPLALWYTVTGNREQAIAMLTRGTRPGAIPPSAGVDPLFDALRTDARFASLLSRGAL
jgi:hypothetical protein